MSTILERDSDLYFPSVTIVTASAGSGKTHALTRRFVQFLLSKGISHNSLKNLLAITFTNNAAKEMRERVLEVLKKLCLGDPGSLKEVEALVSITGPELGMRACALIDDILENYTDFQVRTIDSFMATVFKSSSLDFGFHPDFEILMRNDTLVDYTFDVFSRNLKKAPENAEILDQLVELISQARAGDGAYLWDPYEKIAGEVKKLYSILASQTRQALDKNLSPELEKTKERMRLHARRIGEIIRRSGAKVSHNFQNDLVAIESGQFNILMNRALKASAVNMPRTPVEREALARWKGELDSAHAALNEEIRNYTCLHARQFYQPYLRAIGLVDDTLNRIKRQYGRIFIDDVNKKLIDQLNKEVVPEVYFKLGDTIYHYLIDEFQDTSPIQWANLKPLIENSLSQGGSLFIVGDTKQSIFGFRRADWRIMKRMTEQPEFPAARHEPRSLPINYRSFENIIAFNTHVFQEIVPGTDYAAAARESGLDRVVQQLKPGNEQKGYVEVVRFDKSSGERSEMTKVLNIIAECTSRGYRYRDIAILTRANQNVVEISAVLNEKGIPFLSYSSLDVRKRKVTGEIIALLRFLDSPIDDLSFSVFLLGDIFRNTLQQHRHELKREQICEFVFEVRSRQGGEHLYKAFQSSYPHLWEKFFGELYTLVGYLPLYDVVSEVYRKFAVFQQCPGEEAAFVKVLEVVKEFEQKGNNSIKDFLDTASDENDGAAWEIDVPTDMNAVRVMTVHKAKGLGFPVVIVLLYEEPREPGRSYIIEETEEGVSLLRVTGPMKDKDEHLQRLYEEQDLATKVDRLNQLYVAFTRAMEEMYVLGVYEKEIKAPINLLPESGYQLGMKCSPIISEEEEPRQPGLHHSTIRNVKPFKEGGKLSLQEMRRGDLIHAILSRLEYVDKGFENELAGIISSARENAGDMFPEAQVRNTILSFLDSDIREYFVRHEGRSVLREQEFSNQSGALFRADRVVVDPDTVTVIDFKTGSQEMQEDHLKQIKNYMEILVDIFPRKRVAGVLAYIDRKTIRTIP